MASASEEGGDMEQEKPPPESKDFTNISLDDATAGSEKKRKKKKVPRKILHFNDGILEEYSTDDEPEEYNDISVTTINPKTLKWLPWIWYQIKYAAFTTLGVADTCGEKLAWVFGITSPKYQYAIDEHHRNKAEDAAEAVLEQVVQDGQIQVPLPTVDVINPKQPVGRAEVPEVEKY